MITGSELQGKVALISGCTQGIGFAITERFLSLGAAVVGFSRREDGVIERLREAGAPTDAFTFVPADLTSDADLERVVASAQGQGRIDILINNAGGSVVGPKPLEAMEAEVVRSIIALNLTAPLLLSQGVGRIMAQQDEGGLIINISSTASLMGARGLAAYSAAKAGMNVAGSAIAREWGPRVRVNTLVLGMVETDGMRARVLAGMDVSKLTATIPAARLGKTSEVAEICAFLATDPAAYINGAQIVVDGGARG